MQDAKKTTITFGGATIGGLDSYTLLEGQVREATFRPLAAAPVAMPSYPDRGTVVLDLYRDDTDAGQIALQSSLDNRTRATMIVTHPDGTTDTFTAFTLTYTTRGSKSMATPVQRVRCTLRVSGTVA